MPEWALRCYVKMLPRLQAEEQIARLSVLLTTNERHLSDIEQRSVVSALERQAAGDNADPRSRAPKITRSQLARLGFQMAPATPTTEPTGKGVK